MPTPLKLLLVDDSSDDALLIARTLEQGDFKLDYHRLDDPNSLRQALREQAWDLIISDHNLPGFSSQDVLTQIKTENLDLPVIIVSGVMGEEIAVDAMRNGAHDYIMKNNLARLAPAIERELRSAQRRRAQRLAEATIHHMAFHDALTDLVNRREFENRLDRAMYTARHRQLEHALLYLDLDQFKIINDTCGHLAGDELLKQLAGLLRSQLRDADTLARLGGDEFGVLLESCLLTSAVKIAETLRTSVENFRFIWQGKPFSTRISIGLVPITGRNDSVTELLSSADAACYAAKDSGRNCIQVYVDGNLDVLARHGEMEWVGRINAAIEQNQFELHTQTILPLKPNGQLSYREFLLRMCGPENSLIPPGAFIPAAERYNLMPLLDRWVIDKALSLLSRSPNPTASRHFINVSGSSLSDPLLFKFIEQSLLRYQLPGDCVCFEITETAAIANFSAAVEFIRNIKAHGCKLALDDFGSGLSSFAYLKAMPVDYLKIDGAFVRNMLNDPIDASIVEAINKIGADIGIQTIAEFVENNAIKEKLITLGVSYAQGFGIDLPKPFTPE